MASTTFTLFLAKENLGSFADYFTENAQHKIPTTHCQIHTAPEISESATVYIFRGTSPAPAWLRKLKEKIEAIELFTRQSAAAVMLFKANDRVFAVTFSHGWMLLDDSKFEADFGLKVAVNSLDPSKLKRLERSNLGDALKGVAQSPFQREFRSFGVDDALDLIRKLSGSTNDGSAFDSVTGSRSLKITGEYTLEDLPELAEDALDLFGSDLYQGTSFSILDSVKPISDSTDANGLFEKAVESIINREDRFELSLPSNTEAEGISFQFSGPNLRKTFPDLLLRHYVAAMGNSLDEIDSSTLSKHKIIANFDEDRPRLQLSLKRSLVGSLTVENKQYAINDGQWYRIDDNFRTSVEGAFDETYCEWDIPKPSPPKKTYVQNNGSIEREEDYNIRIAEELGLICLDQKLISIPNVVRSSFEACDLLDIENRRFIHVKKNSRRSSVLSHFFKQGSNSAQQFKKVPATWLRLSQILADNGHIASSQSIDTMVQANDLGGWSCEFWIADAAREAGGFNIPFFSKITLRDEVSEMRAMEYGVALRFIEIQPDQI